MSEQDPASAAARLAASFGFEEVDPAAAGISQAAMEDFLANQVEPQFLGAGWTTHWSSATDAPIPWSLHIPR